MESNKIEQMNKNEEMSSFGKAKKNYYAHKEWAEKHIGLYTDDITDYVSELEQQNAELMDGLEKIKSLSKSKAVNNPLDQIYIVADISIQNKGGDYDRRQQKING